MARRIQFALATLMGLLCLGFAFPAQSQAASCQGTGGVSVVLSSGATLQPGNYTAVITINGQQTAARIQVSACDQVTPGPTTPTPGTTTTPAITTATPGLATATPGLHGIQRTKVPVSSLPSWLGLVLAAFIPLVLLLLAGLIHFRVLVPRRKRKPYLQARKLMQTQRYDEALPLLTNAESQLPDHARWEARFFIAFTEYQMHNITEAEYHLTALYREDPNDQHVAYLLAQVLVEKREYDQAEPILEHMEAKQQLGLHHARKLLGLVKFQRGLKALAEGRVDAAGSLFEKVKELGDYAGKIPADLRNRHILLGTRYLFDKNVSGAREQFTSLQSAAMQISGSERPGLLATAQLGLALADWIEDKRDGLASIEGRLSEAALLFASEEPLTRSWLDKQEEPDIEQKLSAIDARQNLSLEARDLERCLRDLHFLRGMALLKTWSLMDGKAAYNDLKPIYQTALERFACALAHDADFSDVLMVVGLLKFYLHRPGSAARDAGIDLMEKAQKGGVREPDVIEIINNRKRMQALYADAIDNYMQMLDKYLQDDTVRTEVRLALIERLSRYKRIIGLGRRPDLVGRHDVEPTVGEIRNRSETLRARIEQILASQEIFSDFAKMHALSIDLQDRGMQLHEQARAIERTEAELLVLTGNQLLRDQ